MNVVVALEHRFDRTPDGAVWSQTMFPYAFWTRYLKVFDAVRVVARVREMSSPQPGWKQADGEGVSFAPVPYYRGPWQYLRFASRVREATRSSVGRSDAVILRVPSTIATSIEAKLRQTGHPYGVEVVGDPYDVFSPGAFRHFLRPFFRWWFPRQLRRQCAGACAGAYVTEQALQRRYPCPGYAVGVSDVEISESCLAATSRHPRARGPFTLITVGSLAHFYKAPDILIDAVGTCVREGLDLKLVLVGDGKYRGELESRAASLNLGHRVRFTGQLTAGEAVRDQLDQADIFVLPSRQEGLPRAMVEAMARGLPAIASTVGGFPELLPPEDLVPPGDATALSGKICEVLGDPERLAKMAARNLEKARDYRDEVLRERRIAFYQYVKDKTDEWLQTQQR